MAPRVFYIWLHRGKCQVFVEARLCRALPWQGFSPEFWAQTVPGHTVEGRGLWSYASLEGKVS